MVDSGFGLWCAGLAWSLWSPGRRALQPVIGTNDPRGETRTTPAPMFFIRQRTNGRGMSTSASFRQLAYRDGVNGGERSRARPWTSAGRPGPTSDLPATTDVATRRQPYSGVRPTGSHTVFPRRGTRRCLRSGETRGVRVRREQRHPPGHHDRSRERGRRRVGRRAPGQAGHGRVRR